ILRSNPTKRPLSSSSLRGSKKRRLEFILRSAGLFQHLRNLFPHDVYDIVRQQMVARALDLLPDRIFAYGILRGHSQIVSQYGNDSFPSARCQPKREPPFLSLVNEAVLKLFVYAADNTS